MPRYAIQEAESKGEDHFRPVSPNHWKKLKIPGIVTSHTMIVRHASWLNGWSLVQRQRPLPPESAGWQPSRFTERAAELIGIEALEILHWYSGLSDKIYSDGKKKKDTEENEENEENEDAAEDEAGDDD